MYLPHDSFYVGSDVFYTFIVENHFWDIRVRQRKPEEYFTLADEFAQRLLDGKFSRDMEEELVKLLEYYGQDPIIYFTSITESDGFVYCLYFGDKQSSFLSLNASESEPLDVKSTLFVFNNEGKLCAKYKLDDVYERCQVSNGKLYLTNISHERSGLYVLPVTELIN